MEIELKTSELKEKAKTLRAGDKVLLTGTVYTSRDAAHKRIKEPQYTTQARRRQRRAWQ